MRVLVDQRGPHRRADDLAAVGPQTGVARVLQHPRTLSWRHVPPAVVVTPWSFQRLAMPLSEAPVSRSGRRPCGHAPPRPRLTVMPSLEYPNARRPPAGRPCCAACCWARFWRAPLRSTSPRATEARMRPTRRPASVERSRSPVTVAMRSPVLCGELDEVLELGQLPREPVDVPGDQHFGLAALDGREHVCVDRPRLPGRRRDVVVDERVARPPSRGPRTSLRQSSRWRATAAPSPVRSRLCRR